MWEKHNPQVQVGRTLLSRAWCQLVTSHIRRPSIHLSRNTHKCSKHCKSHPTSDPVSAQSSTYCLKPQHLPNHKRNCQNLKSLLIRCCYRHLIHQCCLHLSCHYTWMKCSLQVQ